MYDIITFGSATKDLSIKPKKLTVLKYKKGSITGEEICFPLGSKIDVEDIKFTTGGGGTNTAATFAKQGFKTAFCGMVGNDLDGKEVITELKKLKVNTSLVLKTNKKLTSHGIIILDHIKERTVLVYRGASELLSKRDIPWKKIKTKWIYLAPLSGKLCECFEEIVSFANKNDIKVAVNPGIAQLGLNNFSQIAKKIDLLVLNQEEASFLTKIPFSNEKEIFKKIDEMCPGITLMTKGGEGVVVSDGKYLYSAVPHQDRKVVDTTGAGDSYASGFLSDFIRNKGDIVSAIQFGMANSEGCLSEVGAKNGLLKKGEKFRRVEVKKM